MKIKELIIKEIEQMIKEIEQMPDEYLLEVLDFIRFLWEL